MALASGWLEVVQPFDLLGAQLDAVGGGVLLDAGDPLGARDRGDIVAPREQPGQSDQRGGLVGYESPSQFSREYSRLFGAPPQRDIRRMRLSQTSSRQ